MKSQPTLIGTNGFCAKVNCSIPTARKMELLGIVSPEKTDAGWRLYSPADVEAARKWMGREK